jgi:CheY-like chemotaxis protein
MARILLIDNEAQSREIMRHALVDANHEVLEAEHGRQGMALLQAQRFDLVITEMLMPEVDGVEVIRSVRTLCPDAKIIALSRTGRASPYLYLTIAAKLGAHKVLAKPFQPTELLETVAEVLNGASGTH